jgi:hypothetical protein
LYLINGVSGHLQTITQLLYEGQSAHLHCILCTLASETAQILGKILFDLCEFHLAWAYYSLSLKAAEEAKHTELWIVGMGRMALLLTANRQHHEALSILQEAQQKPIKNNLISSWISTVEAEVYADQHNIDNCLKALYRAKEITTENRWEKDSYATGFNLSRLAGYEGSCYLRLEQPVKALPALQRSLDLLEPGSFRRRSRLFTYISEAYAQLGDIQSVEQYASEALALTAQTGSLSVLQRIQELHDRLERWKENSSVKLLEEQLRDTKLIISNRQEMQ